MIYDLWSFQSSNEEKEKSYEQGNLLKNLCVGVIWLYCSDEEALLLHVILENDWQFRCEASSDGRFIDHHLSIQGENPGKFVRVEISPSFLSLEAVESKIFLNYDFNQIVIKDFFAADVVSFQR